LNRRIRNGWNPKISLRLILLANRAQRSDRNRHMRGRYRSSRPSRFVFPVWGRVVPYLFSVVELDALRRVAPPRAAQRLPANRAARASRSAAARGGVVAARQPLPLNRYAVPTHLVLNSYLRFSPPDSGKSAASPVRLADETATFLEPGNCILIPSAGSFTSRNCLVQNGFRALAGGSAILGILRA